MTLLIIYLCVALLVSFLCSILEAVLLSITPSFVASLEEKGDPLGPRLNRLKSDIDKPLAAILSFNTIAHTVGAAGVGAQAAKVFGNEYLGIVSGVLTLLILIFSEIIPKTLGALYWRGLAGFTAQTLKVLIFLMYPLVILSKGITRIIAGNKKNEVISRDEGSGMTQIGADAGIFKENESIMLRNMIRLRDVKASDVMTPRSVAVMAPESLTVKEWYSIEKYKTFSRIPVYHENRDDITGYVHKNDILISLADDHDEMQLKELRRDIMHVSLDEDLPVLLDKLLKSQEHMALVTDSFGSVAGIVTQEDIIETVVGVEILDEFDSHADMQEFARDQWKIRAAQRGLLDVSGEKNKE